MKLSLPEMGLALYLSAQFGSSFVQKLVLAENRRRLPDVTWLGGHSVTSSRRSSIVRVSSALDSFVAFVKVSKNY